MRAVAARIEPGMRVGVDGVSAAGKTTFADARGEGADSYYEDTFDATRFRVELLEPFARGEPIRTRICSETHST